MAGVRLPAPNPYALAVSLFWEASHRLLQLRPKSTLIPPVPLPTSLIPSDRLFNFLLLSLIYTYRSYLVLRTHFWGSSIFEASHFDFSPAASFKLTTKGWCRRRKITRRSVFQFFRTQPSLQSNLPNRDTEIIKNSRKQPPLLQNRKTILLSMRSPVRLVKAHHSIWDASPLSEVTAVRGRQSGWRGQQGKASPSSSESDKSPPYLMAQGSLNLQSSLKAMVL